MFYKYVHIYLYLCVICICTYNHTYYRTASLKVKKNLPQGGDLCAVSLLTGMAAALLYPCALGVPHIIHPHLALSAAVRVGALSSHGKEREINSRPVTRRVRLKPKLVFLHPMEGRMGLPLPSPWWTYDCGMRHTCQHWKIKSLALLTDRHRCNIGFVTITRDFSQVPRILYTSISTCVKWI